ncbi:beta-N-acetylhexosaminidase [Acetobacter sp. AN02]|uniref:beta-N-acetylhexosaminidase n=1 Tax=Acetobacter sp. AN02 TaxID=2894186 RepID=UPI00243430CA|nr:family 20 glycosylhydrolase [Acetobacter sp. AN02]MDG6094725.1 beta-N-acetylhexosaminidase [Acetobacter sp. AN02]
MIRHTLRGLVCALPLLALPPSARADAPSAAAPALMPWPAHAEFSDGMIDPSAGFRVSWDNPPSALLEHAATRFLLRADRLISAIPRHTPGTAAPVSLRIICGNDPDMLTIDAKEAYRLRVRPDGIKLTADGPEGVIHGLATLLQLIRPAPSGGAALTLADIRDKPRFVWRGLMIDTSRHFVSVDTLRRQIDAMELVKLNVLHLHLSDGTGFRMESTQMPDITRKSTHGQYYTKAQLSDLVARAADRGIRVVPEIDVPGHTLALLLARPDLAAHTPVDPEPKNKNNPALDPTLPATLSFISTLFTETTELFPDRYFHAGGDEVVSGEWTGNPRIRAFMTARGYATPQILQAQFTAEVEKILAAANRTMIGWDEVSEAPIPASVVIQVWRSSKFIASATDAGHPVVVSAGYYLDLLRPASEHYLTDPEDPAAEGLTRAQTAKRLARGADPVLIAALQNDPAPPPLSRKQRKLILGGEAPLWTELVTDEMLDARLWPRSAAIAERFWSSADLRDVNDMYRRLEPVAAELEITGLHARANTIRMAERLAPGDAGPLQTLAGATMPLRNYMMNRYTGLKNIPPDQIAGIASPDPMPAIRFNAMAARYAAGDRSLAASLRAQLLIWKNNELSFASSGPHLKGARAASHTLSVLAGLGLTALDHPGSPPDPAALQILDDAAARLVQADDMTAVFGMTDFPPGGLLMAAVPGIRSLITPGN